MSPALPLLAFAALVPAMTGPNAAERQDAVRVALCAGGSVSIPLDGSPAPGERNAPCCAKGCHAGQSRKRLARR